MTAWVVVVFSYKSYSVFLLILSFQILATCFDISWLYSGLEKFKYTILINTLAKMLGIVLIFLLVKTRDDLWKYILIVSFIHFAGNATMWLFLPKVLVRTKINIKTMSHHFKETLVYFVPSIAVILYSVLDKTLIGFLVQGTIAENNNGEEIVKKISDIENGYYEQATSIITMAKTVCFTAINAVMTSRISFLYKIGETEKIKELVKRTFSITMFLSIGAAFGLSIISQRFVPLFFGEGYEKTTTLLYILSSMIPVVCVSAVIGSLYYTPIGKRKQSSLYTIVGTLINLFLSIPLIILLKSVGAAIASLIAEFMISFLYFINCKSAISFKDFVNVIIKKMIAGIIMLIFTYRLDIVFLTNVNPILSVLISVISGFLIYTFVLFAIRDEICFYIVGIVKKVFRRKEV